MNGEIHRDIFQFHPPDGGQMYMVKTEAGLVMIDSGFLRFKDFFIDSMRKHGLDPRDIKLGFATHFHCDHIGGMGWWQKEFKFPVVAHEQAVRPMEMADKVSTAARIPFVGFEEEFIPCPVTYPVKTELSLTVDLRTFKAYRAPGHTVGSIHVFLEGAGLFVGDTLFADGSVGWIDVHWGSHPGDYVETLERMRGYLGSRVFPGHGKSFILEEFHINKAKEIASFYIPTTNGLGSPRGPSQYAG